MRRDSALIFIGALIISAGIVGTVSYVHHVKTTGSTEVFTQNPRPQLKTDSTNKGQVTQSQQSEITPAREAIQTLNTLTAPQRTNTIIECTMPDGSKMFTNAARCEDADLENRISEAQVVDTPYLDQARREEQSSIRRTNQTSRAQKPNLRGPGRSPPSGLPPECRFPVGRALEIERMLSAADDPYESGWRESYCRFRNEACEDQCPVSDRYYFYRVHQMCQEEFATDCPYED